MRVVWEVVGEPQWHEQHGQEGKGLQSWAAAPTPALPLCRLGLGVPVPCSIKRWLKQLLLLWRSVQPGGMWGRLPLVVSCRVPSAERVAGAQAVLQGSLYLPAPLPCLTEGLDVNRPCGEELGGRMLF